MPKDTEVCCPRYQKAAEVLTKRWTPQLIRMLLSGHQYFSELRTSVPGLSDRLLSERLKELEMERIVERHVYPETPVRIEYCLTKRGIDMGEIVVAIQRWADKWDNIPV